MARIVMKHRDIRARAWIDFVEGDEPPPAEALVEVTYADGLTSKPRRAGTLRWEPAGQPDDITAYRVLAYG